MTKLVTRRNRLNAIEQIVESISEPANTVYYVFVGDHTEHANSELQPVYDNTNTWISSYRNMIFGKRLEETDLKVMVRNVPYQSNTIYDKYDDSDTMLYTKDYYVVVNAVSNYHIFKCMDNNNDAQSTIEPNFAHISGTNTFIYQTNDGYRWKYMYTVDSANVVKFETDDWFPVIANTDVSGNAVAGAIDIILVEGEGKGYDNYSFGTFNVGDIKVNGDETLYGLSNSVASSVNGFYTGCSLYLSAGTGSGQYVTITDYYSNSDGKYMATNTGFSTVPDGTTEYQIYPSVEIIGDEVQTVNAVARALVNSLASNSVYRTEMLNRGAGYEYISTSVVANSVVGVLSNSIIRGVYGPYGGHGYDAAEELGAQRLSFTLTFANTESNTITVNNYFQQIGIIRDPLFANVQVDMATVNGSFIADEWVCKIDPVRFQMNCTTVSSSANLDCTDGLFDTQVATGDWLYIRSGDGLSHQLVTVDSVVDNTQIVLTDAANFSCTENWVYQANINGNSYVMTSNSSTVWLTNVSGQFVPGDFIIGKSSGAFANIDQIFRNGDSKLYDTFQNMYKYEGTLTGGSFDENEVVYQYSLDTANALLHSAVSNGGTLTVYTTNQVGQFVTDGAGSVIGSNSGATSTFDSGYSPELVFNSGDILFLQHIEQITRSANTNETFQIIFEF